MSYEEKLLKEWERLDLFNDFIFAKIMSNKDICKHLLELILEVDIEEISYSSSQKTIEEKLGSKGVRLDVYIKDNLGKTYDVELQVRNTGELHKRSRYYQSIMDIESLREGESYIQLNESFIIFICAFDIFGLGLYKYTFKNICLEDKDLFLNDETTKIFINTKSKDKCQNEELKELLGYMENRYIDLKFPYTKSIDSRLKSILEREKGDEAKMLMATKYKCDIADAIAEGREIGLTEGEKRGKEKGIIESIKYTISILQDINMSNDEIRKSIEEKFEIDKKVLEKILAETLNP